MFTVCNILLGFQGRSCQCFWLGPPPWMIVPFELFHVTWSSNVTHLPFQILPIPPAHNLAVTHRLTFSAHLLTGFNFHPSALYCIYWAHFHLLCLPDFLLCVRPCFPAICSACMTPLPVHLHFCPYAWPLFGQVCLLSSACLIYYFSLVFFYHSKGELRRLLFAFLVAHLGSDVLLFNWAVYNYTIVSVKKLRWDVLQS